MTKTINCRFSITYELLCQFRHYSAVDSGGAGGARAPPEFGVQKRGKA